MRKKGTTVDEEVDKGAVALPVYSVCTGTSCSLFGLAGKEPVPRHEVNPALHVGSMTRLALLRKTSDGEMSAVDDSKHSKVGIAHSAWSRSSREGQSQCTRKVAAITVFSTSSCCHCKKAKALLRASEIDFRDVAVDAVDFSRESMKELIALSGRCGIPQVFFGDHFVGGFPELSTLADSGTLVAQAQSACKYQFFSFCEIMESEEDFPPFKRTLTTSPTCAGSAHILASTHPRQN